MPRSSEQNKARYLAEIKAGEAISHTQSMQGVTMDDTCVCSCGWRSRTYWDGDVYAHEEWVQHITAQGAIIAYPDEQAFVA